MAASILRMFLLTAGALAVAGSVGHAVSPGQAHGHYVASADGVELYYRQLGAGDPLIVVHGGPGMDSAYLAADLLLLAESHRLIWYDQRGAGRSTVVTAAASLHIDDHIADLEALREHLGLARAALLGHSWGGTLAARYALAHPKRVTRLVTVGPNTIRRLPEQDDFSRVTAWMNADERAQLESYMAAYQNPESDIRATCRGFFALLMRGYFYLPGDSAPLEHMRGDFCNAPDDALRNLWTVNTLTMESLGDYDWREDFHDLSFPVLVIAGTRDLDPEESYEEWAAAFPQGRLLLVENAGHFPHVEQPEAFFPAVAEFCNEASRVIHVAVVRSTPLPTGQGAGGGSLATTMTMFLPRVRPCSR
jgi:proline iminopeptidase